MKVLPNKRIVANDFYDLSTKHDKLAFLLKFAVLAPSSFNRKPWNFEINYNSIDVYLDYTKHLDNVDQVNREAFISVGCAICNTIIAAEHFGLKYELNLTDGAIGLPVAKIQFYDYYPDSVIFPSSLFTFITNRKTSRKAYSDIPVDKDKLAEIGNCMDLFPNMYFYLTEDFSFKTKLIEFIEEAMTTQFKNKSSRGDIAEWVGSTKKNLNEGLPCTYFGLPKMLNFLTPTIIKHLDISWFVINDLISKIKKTQYFGVFLSSEDSPKHWIESGIAFELLFLTLTSLSIKLQPLTSLLQVSETREKLSQLLGGLKFPQMIFRMGY